MGKTKNKWMGKIELHLKIQNMNFFHFDERKMEYQDSQIEVSMLTIKNEWMWS